MASLKTIVEHYGRNHRRKASSELRWFEIQKTLEDAVATAALAQTPSGKRFDHQRRIPRQVLKRAEEVLLGSLAQLKQCATFSALHLLVAERVRPIQGIGELYIYDTALRIGAKLGIAPERVYLHAGTRVGARNLGLSGERKTIAVSEVPEALRVLEPREIEDVLCIYAEQINGKPLSERGCGPQKVRRTARGERLFTDCASQA
jgi:hypothetical protein